MSALPAIIPHETHSNQKSGYKDAGDLETHQKRIYIAQFNDGTVKIGKSQDVEARVRTLATQAGRTVDKVFCTEPCVNHSDVERTAHQFFGAFRGEGEFFKIPFNEAVSFVKTIEMYNYTEAELKELGRKEKIAAKRLVEFISGGWDVTQPRKSVSENSLLTEIKKLFLVEVAKGEGFDIQTNAARIASHFDKIATISASAVPDEISDNVGDLINHAQNLGDTPDDETRIIILNTILHRIDRLQKSNIQPKYRQTRRRFNPFPLTSKGLAKLAAVFSTQEVVL